MYKTFIRTEKSYIQLLEEDVARQLREDREKLVVPAIEKYWKAPDVPRKEQHRAKQNVPKGLRFYPAKVGFHRRTARMGNTSKLHMFLAGDRLCFYCRRVLTTATFTIDHFIPRALGGTNAARNLRIACADCNGRKGDHLWRPAPAFRWLYRRMMPPECGGRRGRDALPKWDLNSE